MNRVLDIFGKAIDIGVSDLIWNWLDLTLQNSCGDENGDILGEIVDLASERHFEQAENKIKFYLFENPSCIKGRMAAAAICLQVNDIDEAIEQLKSVYIRQANNTLALYGLGHCYERKNQQSRAVEFYQDCLKFKNHLQLPRLRLATIYFKSGQLEKTVYEYEQLKAEYPDDISILLLLGNLYILAKQYQAAEDVFNSAILVHPDNFHGDNGKIDALVKRGHLAKAMELLDARLGHPPYRPDLMLKKADLFSLSGDIDLAHDQYEQTINCYPDFLEAIIKFGTHYLQIGQLRSAAMQFNLAIEINDRIVDSYIGLATAQKLGGKKNAAMETLALASAIGPNSAILFTETAILNLKSAFDHDRHDNPKDLIDMVFDVYRQAISQSPDNADLHYRHGILLMSVGKTIKAMESFQAAVNLNPNHLRARKKLLLSIFESGSEAVAYKSLSNTETISPDVQDLYYQVSLLFCDRMKFASSVINLEHHLEQNLTDLDISNDLSVLLQNLGLVKRSTAMWDSLEEITSMAIGSMQK